MRSSKFVASKSLAMVIACSRYFGAWRQETPAERDPFKLEDWTARSKRLGELRGSVVLISFGATWCAPCEPEFRALEEMLKEYRWKAGKVFLGQHRVA